MGMLILTWKVMWKFRPKEVLGHVIALARLCEKGMQFNWSQYLCTKFLANVFEVQEEGNHCYYAWLLLLIVLIGWKTPQDTQFPNIEPNMYEVAHYTHYGTWRSPQESQWTSSFGCCSTLHYSKQFSEIRGYRSPSKKIVRRLQTLKPYFTTWTSTQRALWKEFCMNYHT